MGAMTSHLKSCEYIAVADRLVHTSESLTDAAFDLFVLLLLLWMLDCAKCQKKLNLILFGNPVHASF